MEYWGLGTPEADWEENVYRIHKKTISKDPLVITPIAYIKEENIKK